MPRVDTETQLCAVIGNPVEHSLSPVMHNAAFEATGLNYVYVAFRVENVGACITGMRALPSFRGMSVTIPHKIAVMEHLDAIEPMARHVGCVNTVTNDNGTLSGSITDGLGTLRAFSEAGVDFTGRSVLFIGTGGAARAVSFAMAERTDAARITLLGRTPAHVAALADDLRAKTAMSIESGPLNALEGAMAAHDIVIQGTPVGMHPNSDASPVPKALFRPEQIAFDMVYRPHRTRFLREAEEAGCQTIPGIEMLINQAVLQFELWTATDAPVQAMRDAVVAALE
ncbi:MAG: shikimate dehydrogenase [Candidatus Hydrogenedentes bacterium]|nr:shikimate dehydrogenase [Candidatus Hydrogenedentota bacterium]